MCNIMTSIDFLHVACMDNSTKSHRPLFILICVAYCALTISYAILTPPWEAPDEPAHYLYVAQLAERWRPPLQPNVRQTRSFSQDYPYISSNHQWYQPALGYLPSALEFKIIESLAPEQLPRQIPPLNPLYSTNSVKYPNLFVHTPSNMFLVWGGNAGLLIIRVLSSLWGLVVICAAYQIGILIEKGDDALGIAAAAAIAFLPQFTFINASVRGDTIANAIGALVFLLSAQLMLAKNSSKWRFLGLGFLLALGVLAKQTFLYLLPVGALGVILSDNSRNLRLSIERLLLVFAPVLVIGSAYYLVYEEARSALSYVLTTMLAIQPNRVSSSYIQQLPMPLFADLFYARFGWANFGPPLSWSRFAFAFWLVGIALTLFQIIRLWKNTGWSPWLRVLALLFAGILLATAGVIRFNLAVMSPQGRYLFPALVTWAIISLWGAYRMLGRRGKALLTGGLAGLMLVYNLISLLLYLVTAYY